MTLHQTWTRTPLPSAAVAAAVARAGARIPPLWPLTDSVAVNPFLGLSELDSTGAAARLAEVAGARLTMPRQYYAQAIAEGRIQNVDLAAALAEAEDLPWTVAALERHAAGAEAARPAPLPTVAEVVGAHARRDYARLLVERISAWASAYFDADQASWRSPWAERAPYAAWRAEALRDRTPELMGVKGFRASVRRQPETAREAIHHALQRLGLEPAALEKYLHRLLMSIAGWAGHARYRAWESARYDRGEDDTMAELLAVRLAWELALLDCASAPEVTTDWARTRTRYAEPARLSEAQRADLVLQAALEQSWQRELAAALAAPVATATEAARVQAVFCIDVRSEVLRRALETVAPGVETKGFAGFFGLALAYRPLGEEAARAQCPALVAPSLAVHEEPLGDDAASWQRRHLLRRRLTRGLQVFKSAAVASFSSVETFGLAYAGKLLLDGLGWPRGATAVAARPPRLSGATVEARVGSAEKMLRGMALTRDFARLVLLVGHGATTANNPQASALNCGACGGHSGAANARVAAELLNDPAVRAGLVGRGIDVPAATRFVAALHDTTTDELRLFDSDLLSAAHAEDLGWLRARLDAAATYARSERARRLGVAADADAERALRSRSRDWSQTRPEWGLAGCGAFIAAPRQRVAGRDLGGRAFLHCYDWRQDDNHEVLELIMTAPLVVASWISLQYYGSTVDNRVFGSGNKTLHNVVGGTLGVLEGQAGDLRGGLALQSVHNGRRYVHEPVRLCAVIEAPVEAMTAIIRKHPELRRLLDNGWLYLFALGRNGRLTRRYAGDLRWTEVEPRQAELAA